MLPSSFASPISHAKAPLNVVLIIDTHLPPGLGEAQTERAVSCLRRSLVRILLYFQCNMDAKSQWTYQFFNSRVHQDIGLISNRVLQNLNMGTVENCVEEYRKIITENASSILLYEKGAAPAGGAANKSSGSASVSPCYNLRRQLVHSLADFGLDIASYQSPMRPASSLVRSQSLQKHFPPVNIRNYMYILSPLPRTWSETVRFLEGHRQTQSDAAMMGPRRSDILEVLKGVKDAFFGQGLWDRFLDQRTSLSWVDTSTRDIAEEQAKTHSRISATILIRSTLELIMKAFGGHIIPQSILCQRYPLRDIHSFATIFQPYRSLQIHPGLGVNMSKDQWQALPSVPLGAQSEDILPVNVIWSGEVICAQSSQYICSIDLTLTRTGTTRDDGALGVDQIESLHVIKRISSRMLSASLHLIRIANTVICFPQEDDNEPCEHASYLLRSLRSKNDVLLLEITFQRGSTKGTEQLAGSENEYDSNEQEQSDQYYTRLAMLHSTAPGSGVVEILDGGQDLLRLVSTAVEHSKARPFSMAMMEKSWSKIGAFVEQADKQTRMKPLYHLDKIPPSISACFRKPQVAPDIVDSSAALRPSSSKPLPGESLVDTGNGLVHSERAKSIDHLCLEIRKTYVKYLYQDETVSDYVKRLNAASKEITALAAKQSAPLKDAQQKLVAFMIEFLRIWPSRMVSKYKQIAKELNAGKFTESKSQDNYVFLEDERPELDAWKAQVLRSVKDENVRSHLKKLKTKDTQIQIVQNLHILLLIDKYGLEENKPFKKDPGALKTVNLFMDELSIAASIEDRPTPGLMSPQTPRSKDMDPAKKFFVRVVARYYEPSLPKVVEKLSVKCGVEKSLLTSPRPSRGSKRAGMKRSISMGVLQKPSPLDLSEAMRIDAGGPPTSGGSGTPTPVDTVAPKYGFPMMRQSTSDNPAKNVLNSSIFRNRQVVMTRGSVQGISTAIPPTVSSGSAAVTATPPTRPHGGPVRSKSMNAVENLEDEDAPPKLAKLKLKKFYHDKESEEVLKLFRRHRPLSKADSLDQNPFESPRQGIEEDGEDDDDDDDLGALGKYLPRRGTTSWGVINGAGGSVRDDILKSPSMSAVQRRTPVKRRDSSPTRPKASSTLLLLPTELIVPSTPMGKDEHNHGSEDGPKTPSTPTGRVQLRRFLSQQNFSNSNHSLPMDSAFVVPRTPTRRAQVQQGRTFASSLRGGAPMHGLDVLGSPGKRRRGGSLGSDEEESELDDERRFLPHSPSVGLYRRSQASIRSSSLETFLPQQRLVGGGTRAFFEELRASGPDRKRAHLDGLSDAPGARAVLVPSSPMSTSSTAESFSAKLTSSIATTNTPLTPGSKETMAGTMSTSTDSEFLSTPKSMSKSAAMAAAHFGLTTPSGMHISSPTPVRDPTRRQIDFSLFSADD